MLYLEGGINYSEILDFKLSIAYSFPKHDKESNLTFYTWDSSDHSKAFECQKVNCVHHSLKPVINRVEIVFIQIMLLAWDYLKHGTSAIN